MGAYSKQRHNFEEDQIFPVEMKNALKIYEDLCKKVNRFAISGITDDTYRKKAAFYTAAIKSIEIFLGMYVIDIGYSGKDEEPDYDSIEYFIDEASKI